MDLKMTDPLTLLEGLDQIANFTGNLECLQVSS